MQDNVTKSAAEVITDFSNTTTDEFIQDVGFDLVNPDEEVLAMREALSKFGIYLLAKFCKEMLNQ